MGVEALLDALERDARSEAQQIRAEAQSRAEATIAQAAATVNRRRALVTERLVRERRAELARSAAVAARTLKARLLSARARLVDEVFLQARHSLTDLPPSRWVDHIPPLLTQTLRYLESDNSVVRCQPEVRSQVQLALESVPGVRLEASAEALPGLVARSNAGDVVVDNTLIARLERSREDLAIRLLRRVEDRNALG
jgi:vacuolar-type H+-ATPase subunit E/Vma4